MVPIPVIRVQTTAGYNSDCRDCRLMTALGCYSKSSHSLERGRSRLRLRFGDRIGGSVGGSAMG